MKLNGKISARPANLMWKWISLAEIFANFTFLLLISRLIGIPNGFANDEGRAGSKVFTTVYHVCIND